jgi:hypothetical protein
MTAIGNFLTLVVIGAAIGIAMTRYGRSWLGRHFAGAVGASDLTYVLVGIAGSFMGFHIGLILGVSHPILLYVLAIVGAGLTVWLWRGR